MTRRRDYPVTPAERDIVLREIFDELAQIVFELRDRPKTMTVEEILRRTDAFYPRLSWLFYDGATTPIGSWNPVKYGLPEDELLTPPKGTTP